MPENLSLPKDSLQIKDPNIRPFDPFEALGAKPLVDIPNIFTDDIVPIFESKKQIKPKLRKPKSVLAQINEIRSKIVKNKQELLSLENQLEKLKERAKKEIGLLEKEIEI